MEVAIIDDDGLWTGASGSADLASGVDVVPCNQFLIASISKVFTATAVFRIIDRGVLELDDPVSKWLEPEIIMKVTNTEESTLRHLLSHTSGIPDYYSLVYEMDRINKVDNNLGHFQNGLGLERNSTLYGTSVGHTGGIDGFLSFAQYFPSTGYTIVLLANFESYESTPRLNIYNECLDIMFDEQQDMQIDQ